MSKKLIYLISFVVVLSMAQSGIVKAGLDDDPNLVGWWKLDSIDGNVAIDSSISACDGNIFGDPILGTGSPYDNSPYLLFDGTNDWVDVNHLSFLLPYYTVSLYFRLDGGVTDERVMFSAVDVNEGHGIYLGINRGSPVGRIRYIHRYPMQQSGVGNEDTFSSDSGPFYNDGQWHHLAAVRESDTSRLLYVDGQQVGSNTNALGALDHPARVLLGAVRPGWLARWWSGGMDDVRIYDRALSAAEVEALSMGVSVRARNPNPVHDATDVQNKPTLSWVPGIKAASHRVYLDPNEQKVIARSGCDVNGVIRTEPNYPIATPLELGTTYYWAIDEANGASTWPGLVWRFKTGYYFALDDFESYTDTNSIREVWKADGNATVTLSTYPVYAGEKSMAIDYNNIASPYYCEAYANTTGPNSLNPDIGANWLAKGVKALSLWFRGRPDIRGSWNLADGTHTITGDGYIWGTADGFHYAYKKLSDEGSIQARVFSVEDTSTWAKAGVMIRNTLEPDSMNAAVVVTPSNRVILHYRATTGGESTEPNIVAGITTPHWVKLERVWEESDIYVVRVYHANDVGGSPDAWTQIGEDVDTTLSAGWGYELYIGLCVSSNSDSRVCTGVLDNVTLTPGEHGSIIGEWQSQDIGIPQNFNDPEPMYVALEDGSSKKAVWYYPDSSNPNNADPNVTQRVWTQWLIKLDKFSGQGLDLSDVRRMYIGFGDQVAPGGAGVMNIDDIRLYEPYCVLSERSADLTMFDYAPVGLPAGDCAVDYREIAIMARDWLMMEDTIIYTDSNNITNGLAAYYPLDEGSGTTITDTSGNGHNGTFSEEGLTWVTPGLMGDSAIHVDGSAGSRVSIGTWDPAETGNLTLSLWVRWSGEQVSRSQGLIGKRDGWSGPNDLRFMFEISPYNDYQLAFRQYGVPDVAAAGVMLPYIGRWAHVAVTFDGTISEPNVPNTWIYLNGEEVASGPFTLGSGTGAGMTIGNTMSSTAWPGSPEAFNGDIDEVRIYNRALSQAEIAYLADTTPGDGKLHVPLPSAAELYGLEAEPARAIDLRDFAVLAKFWLEEQLWP